MPAKIIKAATLAELEQKLDKAERDNYHPSGGPFLIPESRSYGQLVTCNLGTVNLGPASELQLREPAPLGTSKARRK